MSTNINIRHTLGTDLIISTTNNDQSGSAINLSSGTALLTVKADKDDLDADAKLSVGGTALDSNGIAVFTLSPSDITSMSPGNYVYNIRVKTSGGKWHETFNGQYIIEDAVSVRVT